MPQASVYRSRLCTHDQPRSPVDHSGDSHGCVAGFSRPGSRLCQTGQHQWSSFNVNALGNSSDLITSHESWLELGDTHANRLTACCHLFEEVLDQHQLDEIRHGMKKGLPTGHKSFKRQIEEALSIKLSNGLGGRPKKISKAI